MLIPDEGYFYGMGAFETIAVEQGVPMLLPAHLARLRRAADFLGLSVSMEEIGRKTEELLGNSQAKEGRKVLKITVSEKNILVNLRENTYTDEDYERGFTAALSPVRRNETSPFTYHKTMNYGDCILEKRRWRARGVDEPIFLNTRGELCEGATTNIFFVEKGEIFTPPVSCGLLPGVMRAHVCAHGPVRERVLRPEELDGVEEMFLTNSLLGIMPVQSLDGRQFPSRSRTEALRRSMGSMD